MLFCAEISMLIIILGARFREPRYEVWRSYRPCTLQCFVKVPPSRVLLFNKLYLPRPAPCLNLSLSCIGIDLPCEIMLCIKISDFISQGRDIPTPKFIWCRIPRGRNDRSGLMTELPYLFWFSKVWSTIHVGCSRHKAATPAARRLVLLIMFCISLSIPDFFLQ